MSYDNHHKLLHTQLREFERVTGTGNVKLANNAMAAIVRHLVAMLEALPKGCGGNCKCGPVASLALATPSSARTDTIKALPPVVEAPVVEAPVADEPIAAAAEVVAPADVADAVAVSDHTVSEAAVADIIAETAEVRHGDAVAVVETGSTELPAGSAPFEPMLKGRKSTKK
jgi:hypothetical protein